MSSNIIRMMKSWMRCMKLVACTRETRNAHKILIIKPEGKRPLERSTHRCEDYKKMYLKEINMRV
jgi:hypothetical protein